MKRAHDPTGVRTPMLRRLSTWLLAATLACGLLPQARAEVAAHSGFARYLDYTNFAGFIHTSDQAAGQTVLLSTPINPGIPWNQLVVCWNVTPGTDLKIEARVLTPAPTPFYVMSLWSDDPDRAPRESVKGQKNGQGDVDTDTLKLTQLASNVQVRLTLSGAAEEPCLKYLGLSFCNTNVTPARLEPVRAAWGRTLSVPERCQNDYEGGKDWCSPTSTSMVLAYWAKKLGRSKLDRDVPEAARGIHDRVLDGTGNWPFNTAWAGLAPGLRAYVTRLEGLEELEPWIAAGVPPVLSICYEWAAGLQTNKVTGHLIVVRGFTKKGEVVVNDPWAPADSGLKVRRVYTRENLARGWKYSQNTVYLIHPPGFPVPPDPRQHWASPKR